MRLFYIRLLTYAKYAAQWLFSCFRILGYHRRWYKRIVVSRVELVRMKADYYFVVITAMLLSKIRNRVRNVVSRKFFGRLSFQKSRKRKKSQKKKAKRQKITIFVKRIKPKDYEEGHFIVIGSSFRVGRIA